LRRTGTEEAETNGLSLHIGGGVPSVSADAVSTTVYTYNRDCADFRGNGYPPLVPQHTPQIFKVRSAPK
jgi:hypothetical protein